MGVMALVGDHGFGRCLSQEHVGSFEAVRLPWREMKSGGPVHPPLRESWRSTRCGCVRWFATPPLLSQHRAGALARWSSRSSRTRCRPAAPGLQRPVAIHRCSSSDRGAGTPPGSLRNVLADRARGCRPGSGTASTNKQLSCAPGWPARPGSQSLMRSH